MGGRSKAEKEAEQQQSQLMQQQQKLENVQQQQEKLQKQELLKRKLATIRASQGQSGFGGSDSSTIG